MVASVINLAEFAGHVENHAEAIDRVGFRCIRGREYRFNAYYNIGQGKKDMRRINVDGDYRRLGELLRDLIKKQRKVHSYTRTTLKLLEREFNA